MAQYTFTGYDASAHMSEETLNADLAAPKGIINSIVVSLVAGWVLILSITFVLPTNMAKLRELSPPTKSAPVLIWSDAIGRHGAELLLAHRLHGTGLLRHGVGDSQFADALRLQP